MQKRIVQLTDIEAVLEPLKASGKKIVATNGCFDILHVGHKRYLEASKKLGDILVIGLNSDSSVKRLKGDTRPINNEDDRAELLAELKSVDYVVIFEEDTASNFLKAVKADFYTKGADYGDSDDIEAKVTKLPEYPVAQELGTKVVFVGFVEGKSSTKVIDELNKESSQAQDA